MNWSEMSNRERDALVALYVENWTEEEVELALSAWESGVPSCGHRDLPEYTTNIADAWRVVESLKERGYNVAVDIREDGVWCYVWKRECVGNLYSAKESTAPEAIAKAALRACGVEV
ncbi:hypothetical protein DNHGIG_14920 [Collibacillus ludicampi]|uniref:Phage ABA sandwich domain-containing protein n=1 Tax=Collibacillus ludicampi TaxID=2771369 RepID=A0AAV4LE59_9BACL|nr:hypothetical protein [Collibacillus ludicampi]GIM45943.1 hypothetical protein DNHGIG_14920 [Collibacillus ludicampi]